MSLALEELEPYHTGPIAVNVTTLVKQLPGYFIVANDDDDGAAEVSADERSILLDPSLEHSPAALRGDLTQVVDKWETRRARWELCPAQPLFDHIRDGKNDNSEECDE